MVMAATPGGLHHNKPRRVPVGVLLALVLLSCTFYTTFRHASLLEDLGGIAPSSTARRYSSLADDARERVIIELKEKILKMEQLHKSIELEKQIREQEGGRPDKRREEKMGGGDGDGLAAEVEGGGDKGEEVLKLLEEGRLRMEKEVEELQERVGNLRREAEELEKSVQDRRRQQEASLSLMVTDASDSSSNNSREDEDRAWLVIGIPTFPRPNHVDYLRQTLDSIAQQLPHDPRDPFYGRVRVIVMNNNGGPGHATFEAARQHFGTHAFIDFVENQERLADPLGDKARDMGNPNKPGYRVRKQTRDLVALLRRAEGRGRYYLFLEDDMLLCPHALLVFQYLLTKATLYHPNWLSVRASYGMNGIFLHDEDVGPFAKYLLSHQARRPPDHLVVEWFAGEKEESARYKGARSHVAFRFNLFHHIGSVSSLRSENQVNFPVCYEALGEPVLFRVEAFKPHDCPNDDVWPCRPPADYNLPRIDWGQLRGAIKE